MGRFAWIAPTLLGAGMMVASAVGIASAQSATVTLDNSNRFAPASITVQPGTTVTWANQGGFHTVTSSSGLFNQQLAAAGTNFSFTFSTPGTYSYFCQPHQALGMTGTVVVAAPQPAPAAAPAPAAPVTAAPAAAAPASAQPATGAASPAQLPRTGEAEAAPIGSLAFGAGVLLVGVGFYLRRRASRAETVSE